MKNKKSLWHGVYIKGELMAIFWLYKDAAKYKEDNREDDPTISPFNFMEVLDSEPISEVPE